MLLNPVLMMGGDCGAGNRLPSINGKRLLRLRQGKTGQIDHAAPQRPGVEIVSFLRDRLDLERIAGTRLAPSIIGGSIYPIKSS